MRKLKVYETIQAPNQFTKTTKLPAVPFTCMGNTCHMDKKKARIRIYFSKIPSVCLFPDCDLENKKLSKCLYLEKLTSDIITQGTGPKPIENAAIYI